MAARKKHVISQSELNRMARSARARKGAATRKRNRLEHDPSAVNPTPMVPPDDALDTLMRRLRTNKVTISITIDGY